MINKTAPTQAQIQALLILLRAKGARQPMLDAADVIEHLTAAAAQVGEPITTAEMFDNHVNDILAVRQKSIEAATIERCAQVTDMMAKEMEELSHQDGESAAAAEMLREASAAIRKLKDGR